MRKWPLEWVLTPLEKLFEQLHYCFGSLMSSPSLTLPFEPALDELTQMQLRVARRADEIATQSDRATPLNIHCWLLAEAELWRMIDSMEKFHPEAVPFRRAS